MEDKEFIYKFQTEFIKGTKVPYSFLRGVLKNICGIAKRINQIDNDIGRDIDFNLEIREGSLEVVTSPISDDMLGLDLLGKTSRVMSEIDESDSDNEYIKDEEVRKRIKWFIKSSLGIVEGFQVIQDGNNIGHEVTINDEILNIYEPSEVQESFVDHIAFLHKIDVKYMRLGLTIPCMDPLTIGFNTVNIPQFKEIVNQFFYVKIDTARGLQHGRARVHTFKKLPSLDTDIISPSLSKKLEERNVKLDEISKLDDKWDGYEAKIISGRTIDIAKEFIKYIAIFIEYFKLEEKLPEIIPVPNGNIQFEWDLTNRSLEIEFNEDEFQILEVQSLDGEEFEKEFFENKYTKSLDSIYRFLREH